MMKDLEMIISLSWLYELFEQKPNSHVERSKNEFTTPSNRWGGRKNEKLSVKKSANEQ